jgi:hypothetical protein
MRTAHKRVPAALAIVVALLGTLFVTQNPASAHHPAITGSASCPAQANDTWTATFQVSNSETNTTDYTSFDDSTVYGRSNSNDRGRQMKVTAVSASAGTLANIAVGDIVMRGTTKTVTVSGIPVATASATLNLTGYWRYYTDRDDSSFGVPSPKVQINGSGDDWFGGRAEATDSKSSTVNRPANGCQEDAGITVTQECDTITVTSQKDISNIIVRYEDGFEEKFDNLSGTTWTLTVPDEDHGYVTDIWVKAGNNKEAFDGDNEPLPTGFDNNGIGEYFSVTIPGDCDPPPPVDCPDGTQVPNGQTCPPVECPDGTEVPNGQTCPPVQCEGETTVPNGQECPTPTCDEGEFGEYPNCVPPCEYNSSIPSGEGCEEPCLEDDLRVATVNEETDPCEPPPPPPTCPQGQIGTPPNCTTPPPPTCPQGQVGTPPNCNTPPPPPPPTCPSGQVGTPPNCITPPKPPTAATPTAGFTGACLNAGTPGKLRVELTNTKDAAGKAATYTGTLYNAQGNALQTPVAPTILNDVADGTTVIFDQPIPGPGTYQLVLIGSDSTVVTQTLVATTCPALVVVPPAPQPPAVIPPPAQPTPPSPPSTPVKEELPHTGGDIGTLVAAALALLGSGFVLRLVGRRKVTS